MLRLLTLVAGTLAALYFVLVSFGDSEGTAGLARTTGDAPRASLSLAALLPAPQNEPQTTRRSVSGPTEAEAIELAIAAGRAWRDGRDPNADLIGLVAAVETPLSAQDIADQVALWYVTGTTVNLRQGPSTSTSVVGQVSLGEAAETLTPTDADWIQIRTAGGQTGWIFSRFLGPDQPG